jgi:uncharacterized phage protein (TIGR02218 family)
MGRLIPLALQEDLQTGRTTNTLLMRVDPVSPGFASYGITVLDRDVFYDDGAGMMRYSAAIGFQPTSLQGSADLSVDNARAESLMPEFDIPISEVDIRAGVYDFARFTVYLVNYENLDAGHITLRSGTLGQITIDADGLSYVNELRGLVAELKQSVCAKDSLICRAIYGSQAEASSTPGPVERYPCGKDATSELVEFTVSSVGLENTLTFTAFPFELEADALNPGMVFWSTGLNAGRSYEVDTNDEFGEITLSFETQFPVEVGDTGTYRPDCNKLARDEEKGCAAPHHWGDEWVLHFRGEPDIPIGDAGALETPGASSRVGQGGYIQIPFGAPEE